MLGRLMSARLVALAVVGIGALALSATARAEDVLAKVKAAGELVVGTEMQFAPFDFVDNGEHKGVNVDIFDEIGKELGVKIKWIDLPWESVLPGLEAGKYDMVGGPATITKARMERYRFSLPIADASVALLKRADDDSITKPEDINGKVVGGGKASAQLEQLQKFVDTLPDKAEVREYVDNNQAYADLAAGRIVAVGNSLPNIAYVAAQRSETFAVVMPPFGAKTYFGYIGRKDADSASLMDAVDAAVVKMHEDGRLAAIQKKWFGVVMDVPQTMPQIDY
jgi:polar amino acid transport system substrate-binding protein